MKTSVSGINLIKGFEGFSEKAYQDSVGVWTIGYGHTKNVVPGSTVTSNQAEDLLRSDLQVVESALNKQGLKLNQNQFDALSSLFFNIGTGYLKNFLPDLKSNPDSSAIPARMLKYVYADGKVLSGLVKRREKESELYKKKV